MLRLPLAVRHRAFPSSERPRRTAATRPRFAGVRQPILGLHLGLGGRRLFGRTNLWRDQRRDFSPLLRVKLRAELVEQAYHLRERAFRLLLPEAFFLLFQLTEFISELCFRRRDRIKAGLHLRNQGCGAGKYSLHPPTERLRI